MAAARLWTGAFFLLVALSFPSDVGAQVPCGQCFPFERLPPETRARAEAMLLRALDREALYTIVGGLKPMSSGFASFRFPVREPRADSATGGRKREQSLAEIDEARRILALWRCDGELYADVHHFARVYNGERFMEAVVFYLPSLRRVLQEYAWFFTRFGLTPHAHPMEVLMAVEYEQSSARFGGYGILFGYPFYAVDFFVRAADEENWTGSFVARDFYSVPTFERPTNSFVWAVPKGHAENETDRLIKRRAEEMLAEYRRRRARYIGPDKPGVVALLRDWFSDGRGICSPRRVASGAR